MIQAGINDNKYDNMSPKTLSAPKMNPKRQIMILKAKEMTLKKQRMTPRMTPRIDE